MESSSQYGVLVVSGYVHDIPHMCVVTVTVQKFDETDFFMCLGNTLNERL